MLKPFFQSKLIEAGCDEAGRGCLAGPVFAGAVILPRGFSHPGIKDSKQLSEKDRWKIREVILNQAISWAVDMVDHTEIDRINIQKASFKAMHLALEKLEVRPGLILVDGNRFTPYGNIPHQTIVGGDAHYASIAAASILAKTFRDEMMLSLHREFPQYGWDKNKGYGTAMHREAIAIHGLSPFHRKTFQLPAGQLSFDI
jgi:ribonuclease HII